MRGGSLLFAILYVNAREIPAGEESAFLQQPQAIVEFVGHLDLARIAR